MALRSFLDFLRDVGGGGPAPVLVAHNAHKFDAVVLARNLMEHGLVEEASRCISVCVNDINISVYMGEITHLEHLPSRASSAPLTWPARQVSYWDTYICTLLHCQNAKFFIPAGLKGQQEANQPTAALPWPPPEPGARGAQRRHRPEGTAGSHGRRVSANLKQVLYICFFFKKIPCDVIGTG